MAEFRKLLYAFGAAALFAGLSSTASAQTQSVTCSATAQFPFIRAEGFTELVGDYLLDCTGGTPTNPGDPVPQVNITITTSAPITSRLLSIPGTGGAWTEALLLIDEPNSQVHPTTPLLACGQAGAPDNGPAGAGVCSIIAPTDPTVTYDGTPNTSNGTTCNGTDPDGNGPLPPNPGNNAYSCGRPNVFQGRQGLGLQNAITFAGVPFNPPGQQLEGEPVPHRFLRVTNVRVAPPAFSAGQLSSVIMSINIDAPGFTINNRDLPVATVTSGISLISTGAVGNFVQCNVPSPNLARPVVFREGFESSFKTKGLEEITGSTDISGTDGNGVFAAGGWKLNTAAGKVYNYASKQVRQNVPGSLYYTESGFTSNPNQATFTPNPPPGIGNTPTSGDNPISNQNDIQDAGIATQGTRIAVRFADLPAGITVVIPDVVYLYPQGTSTSPTGVAVRTVAGARGDGPFQIYNTGSFGGSTGLTDTSGIIFYEVLFSDPHVLEDFNMPIQVNYTPKLASNLPAVTVNTTPTASGGFAPFIDLTQDTAAVWGAAQRASATVSYFPTLLPIPRFKQLGSDTITLFNIGKCSCNLLFPFVTNLNTGRGNYDTGIAIANTSALPTASGNVAGYNNLGFRNGTAQQGAVQLWYFPADPTTASQYPSQCTNAAVNGPCPGTMDVPAGGTLLFSLAAGNPTWGIAPRPGFTGYMVAQTAFQYCHAFAYISAQGAAPADPGMSIGYVALQLDSDYSRAGGTFANQLTPRTNRGGEDLNQ